MHHENNKINFGIKFANLMYTGIFKPFAIDSIEDMRQLGWMIWKNWSTIFNLYQNSNKLKRIKILFRTHSLEYSHPFLYGSSKLIDDDTIDYPNNYLNNLKNDFQDFSKQLVSLDIINSDNNYDIENAIKEKYPNF